MNEFTQAETGAVAFENPRAAFLQKTYLHLLGAVLAFVGIEYFLFTSGLAEPIAGLLLQSWLVTLGLFVLVGWFASRFAYSGGSVTKQYAGLGLYVLIQSLIFVPLLYVAVYYSDASVLSHAAYLTVGVFAFLTGYVFLTKGDFSFLRPFLMIAGIGAMLAIVGSLLFGFTLGYYFSIGMAVFASAAILHDTSKVLHEFGEDQHVAASLQLFASVALLFYYILSLFIQRD